MKKLLIFFISLIFLVGCKPKAGVLPTIEEVSAEVLFTQEEIDQKCFGDGGKYETWVDEDGTENIFCVFEEGWGCDPELYAYGKCGKEF